MATPEHNPGTSSADHRRLRGLVSFLSRQPSLRFEDLDFTHPILAGSTMGELREAMDELARRSNDELCAQYAHWMGSADTFSVGVDASTEWEPLIKLRYRNLRHVSLVTGRSATVWSPADIWLVHYIHHFSIGWQNMYYAAQSLISREPAVYCVKKLNTRSAASHQHHRSNVPATEHRLPPTRPITAMLSEQLGAIMTQHAGAPIISIDADYPLHHYIINHLL